jgi:activator of HSP90 ATPase
MQHRRLIGLVLAGVTAGSATQSAAQQTAPVDNSIAIHQEVDFTASPERLYAALTDAKQFAALSGRAAVIEGGAGAAFSLFDAHIVGRNVELIPGKRVVQAWRAADWPEGLYSIVRFELTAHGTGTRLVFDHTGFPVGQHDHLAQGWEENYWSLLRKYLK